MRAIACGCVAGMLAVGLAVQADAQTSKSAPLVEELVAGLDAKKLTNIAVKDPSADDVFIGALYMPDLQLVVISAQYTAPQLLETRLERQEYREVYLDLNASGTRSTRIWVEDMGADGLLGRNDGDRPGDVYESEGRSTTFDRSWGDQQLSEDEYMQIYAAGDARYVQMLEALLGQLKEAP